MPMFASAKAGLIAEVESVEFKLQTAPAVEGLNEFYMAVFVKSPVAPTEAATR